MGCIDTLARLRDIWHDLTFLFNNKFRIYKEDYGIDRSTEMMLHNANEKIMESRNLVEKVMKIIEENIKNSVEV